MHVVVKFHDSARADYEAWVARLSQPPTGNPGLAAIHVDEMIRQFREHDGRPPDAEFCPDLDPPSWQWRYSADTWVRFLTRVTRAGVWGGPSVEVIVTRVTNRPSAG